MSLLEVSPRRPLLRYHGGKWRIAPWIISYFPPHETYVEPFGGGGSVLIRKERCKLEVYNDRDGEIVNLFRVVRDQGPELLRKVGLTPFAKDEFELSYHSSEDPVEQARRTLVRAGMGFGSTGPSSGIKTGFRKSAKRRGTHAANDWDGQPDNLQRILNRFRGIIIENQDALKGNFMPYYDAPETLFYVDPPYVNSTRVWRGGKDAYKHELTDHDHRQLAWALRKLRGKVIVSGYPSPLYDELFAGWTKATKEALADKAAKRTECLWMNFNPKEIAT